MKHPKQLEYRQTTSHVSSSEPPLPEEPGPWFMAHMVSYGDDNRVVYIWHKQPEPISLNVTYS